MPLVLRAVLAARHRLVVATAVAALTIVATATSVSLAPRAHAAGCSDVDVVFARATGETPGLGAAGTPLVRDIGRDLAGRSVSSYAVNYPADYSQTQPGVGATDMSNHVNTVARQCPDTTFVIGGYSQGGTVTDLAIGISTPPNNGGRIDAANASRVAAVVVFGNPLGLSRRTIKGSSPTYGPKSIEFCNAGDPVCGNGSNFAAHLTYPRDGSVDRGARFAADRVTAGAP